MAFAVKRNTVIFLSIAKNIFYGKIKLYFMQMRKENEDEKENLIFGDGMRYALFVVFCCHSGKCRG